MHFGGTVWASILYEVYWNLLEAKGFSSSWLGSKQTQGNIVMMQLIIAALQLQPCNPSFLNARDAMIFAEQVYYGGIHKCLLWRGFAKRGMGIDAIDFQDGFKIPSECQYQ